MDLFSNQDLEVYQPLAEKLRPTNLDEFYGQDHLTGQNGVIRKMIETDTITSMIFWGPPGVGKTTLAKIIAKETNSSFHELSAVTSGVKEIKELIEIAKFNQMNGQKTIVFVDEIHRFNKAQQDAFLPYVENGTIILIGATTENPSFEVNNALLSRAKVYVLETLSKQALIEILHRVFTYSDYQKIKIDDECLEIIAYQSHGDARVALNTLENVINFNQGKAKITKQDLQSSLNSKIFLYDKKGEEHYNLISALHKSMRNSDADAALYYLVRMLESGEDPLYIARRLIRFASEDIGLAKPQALQQAICAYEASNFIGMPECNVNLAQAVVYLSMCPKSNSLYVAYEKAKKDAQDTLDEQVPYHLRNAVTNLDEQLGYGKGYIYAHDEKNKIAKMTCLPEKIKNHHYYQPTTSGNEAMIKEKMAQINAYKNS